LDNGADVRQATTNGSTALHVAALEGHQGIMALLLANGADVEQARTDNHVTALHVAAFQGHREIVALLLKHGADKTARATTGQRPMDLARQQGHSALIPLLEP
jgi:ankyrin